ncbi:MAG: hypothetical protein E6833_32700, partial [Bradyrhizobium sp.]|nr:hypothetical protein [Bradyrhizobium sp.]
LVAIARDLLDMLAQRGRAGNIGDDFVSWRVRAVHADLHREGKWSPDHFTAGVRKRGDIGLRDSRLASD